MKKIGFIALIVSLSGCASFNSEFDCPASKGIGCKRLSAINDDYNKSIGIDNPLQSNRYVKRDFMDVYIMGYTDEAGNYHRPQKIMMKS